MSDSTSTFFFPLRTNVQYFATPEGFLSLEERIKQAVILYDRVVFQSGLYEATVGPDAAFACHIPPSERQELKKKLRDRRATPAQSLEGFSIWAAPSGGVGPYQLLGSSVVESRFDAEFHSVVERLTSQFNLDGLEISDTHLSERGQREATVWAKTHTEKGDIVLPRGSAVLQKHIVGNLIHDLFLASVLGYASSMDPLHAPLLGQVIGRSAELGIAPGFSALRFEVPNIATLPWDQIAEIRAHPALADYRQRLFEAESLARSRLLEGAESEVQSEVDKILHQGVIEELRVRMVPRGWKLARNVTAQVAGGLVPPLGAIQTVHSVSREVADSVREGKTWLAVMMKLTRAVERPPGEFNP